MDLRTIKTKKSIHNAFIELRSKKPLHKITVKELTETAMISKPTFYLHYKDVYDLSDALESELIDSIISPHFSDKNFEDTLLHFNRLFDSFFAQGQILNILFSYDRKLEFPRKLNIAYKEKIFDKFPQYKDNAKAVLIIDYLVYGAFYTVSLNLDMPAEFLSDTVGNLTTSLLASVLGKNGEQQWETFVNGMG